MKILNQSDYQYKNKARTKPSITINYLGRFLLNNAAYQLIYGGIHPGRHVVITRDNEGQYYIGAANADHESKAFVLRAKKQKDTVEFYIFNCTTLAKEIITAKDLAIAKDRHMSLRFYIDTHESATFLGLKLYLIHV